MMGGRKKDCAGDRRKANSKMTAAAAAADDVAARLRFSRARMICMVELLLLLALRWSTLRYFVRCCVDGSGIWMDWWPAQLRRNQ